MKPGELKEIENIYANILVTATVAGKYPKKRGEDQSIIPGYTFLFVYCMT